MITVGWGQLAFLLAMTGAATGLLVLGIMTWHITGRLDDAYEQGYSDHVIPAAGPVSAACETRTLPGVPLPQMPPQRSSAATGITLRPLPETRPAGDWLAGELARIRSRGQAIVADLALGGPA